jgi:hypothetical protein
MLREERYVSEPVKNKVFKILTVDSVREWWDSTVS